MVIRHLVRALIVSLVYFSEGGATEKIRIGALTLGTLNWELSAMKAAGLDRTEALDLEIQELANPEAGRIALLGKTVDLIVSDWIWVAQQRSEGRDFSFVPFTKSAGALMVAPQSPIQTLKDLKGARLGVAGGSLDKNYVLLKAAFLKDTQQDLTQAAQVSFGAPPLLSQSLEKRNLDAVLTYWNAATKLEAKGYRKLLNGEDIQRQLGIGGGIPTLGYVFSETWARAHPQALASFLTATHKASERICASDGAWQAIAAITQEADADVQKALRKGYCDSRRGSLTPKEKASAKALYQWLEPQSQTTGTLPELQEGVFWTH